MLQTRQKMTSSHGAFSPSSPLGLRQATLLARRMRAQLAPHTKDRAWRLRVYKACFTAAHALAWAREHIGSSEEAAVVGLNSMVGYGLLVHVVDPEKRFRVGETRTLYFRMANCVLNAEETPREESSTSRENGDDDIRRQLSNMDHILQQTVRELNDARGQLEMAKQQVQELASQQMLTFVILFAFCSYVLFFFVPWSGVSWSGVLALILTLIVSAQCWRLMSLWGDLGGGHNGNSDDENSLAEDNIAPISDTPAHRRSSSVRFLVSKSVKLMTTSSGEIKSRRLSIIAAPNFMREARSLPDVKSWPHRPLLICANTPVCPDLAPDHGAGPVPLGVPFCFRSALFEGTCLIRLKGSRSDDPRGDEVYFAGRKRIFQSVVQGRFRERVSVADVLTGHEFSRPLKNLPPAFVLKTATAFIAKVSPGAHICVHSDAPFVDATLGGSSQVVRGDAPGNEPDIACANLTEDCAVFGGAFAAGDVAASRRKRLFANPARCRDYAFDQETVYTFEFYQNLFDAQTYSLDLGFTKIGCSSILNGQPIQWLGKC